MDPIEDIKSKLDIVDIVREYLTLQTAGGNFRARCPFHEEKSASFMVSKQKQIWHCFGGCNEGGDMFKFIMKQEGMEFPEALRYLAQKAGVQLERQNPALATQKNRLLDVLDHAANYYHQAFLRAPQAAYAREYLTNRLTDQTIIDAFNLGYSLPDISALTTYLLSKKFTASEIMQAGLAIQKEQGYGFIDRFRNRLMIPIRDIRGSVIGFGGRILEEGTNNAKYINSPQTPLYDKSHTLFGLDVAKQDIRTHDVAIIVEGYMDFFAVYASGMKNVVASSGTALTIEQIRQLKRFTNHLLFAFDMDAAGLQATARGIENALREGMDVKVIQLPKNADGSKKYKDPDECIRADVDAWRESVEKAQSFMEFFFDQTITSKALSDGFEKRKCVRTLLQSIKLIADRIEQDHWIRLLAQRLSLSETVLWEEFKKEGRETPAPHKNNAPEPQKTKPVFPSREELFIATLFKKSDYIIPASRIVKSEMMRLQEYREAYMTLCELATTTQETPELLLEMVEKTCTGPLLDRLGLLADKEWGDATEKDMWVTCETLATSIRSDYLRTEITRLQGCMREAERQNDKEAMELYTKAFHLLQNM